MPQALPMIAYYAAGEGVVGFLAATVVSLAVTEYQKDSAREKARAAAAAAARDRTITIRSGVAPRRIVLGTVRLGGVLMHAEFVGADQEFLDQVYALTHGEISEFVGLYLDDEFVAVADIVDTVPTSGKFSGAQVQAERLSYGQTLAAASSVTLPHVPSDGADVQAVATIGVGDASSQVALTIVSVVGAVVTFDAPVTGDVVVSYSSMENPAVPLRVQGFMGTDTQASTTWSGVSTPAWTVDHRLRGVSGFRTLTRLDANVFAQGLPNPSAVVRGPKSVAGHRVWDPRSSTYLDYTSNPALLSAWFRTLPRREGGCGVPDSWIDWPSVSAAANVCDELLSVKKLDGSGYETVKRYECHTVLNLDEQSPAENLQIILDSMAGDFPFAGGKYYCYAGAFRAATVTLTDDDIAGDEQVMFAPLVGADQTPPNVMTARIYSSAHNWVETGVPAVPNASYITADGQEEPAELDLVATTDLRQANYLMGVRLEQMRPGLAGTLTVLGRGADLALMDTVQISAQGYEALAGRTFEIRKRTNHWTGRYTLDLREVRSSTYALDADRFTPPTAVTPPDASELWDVTEVDLLSAVNAAITDSNGTLVPRALVTWTAHPQRAVNPQGLIEVRYRSPSEEWTYAPAVSGDGTKTYISPLRVGDVLFIEARARNVVGAVSGWTGIAPFEVTGNNDVPPDITGLSHEIKPGLVRIHWDQAADWHLYETELRVGASWAAGTLLWAGQGTEYHHPRPANGTYTVWAAYRSRAGVYSAAPASISVTVDDSIDPGAGESVYVEYSVDGATLWHSTFVTGDLFARWKIGVGGAWNGPFRIVGETGAAGDYVDFIFKRSATQPATPTGNTPAGWSDAPPAANGNPLWVSTGPKTAAGVLVGVWSTPVQIEGAAGSDAQTLMLTATGFAFVFPTATSTDASAPNQIDFTAALQNVTGTVAFTATAYDSSNSALGARTLTSVTATTCRLTKSNFTTGAGFGTNVRYVRVTATLGSLSDTITIYRADDGANAVQAVLSNEAHVVPTASDGTGGVFTGSSTTIRVFEGVTELTYDGVGSGDGTWRVSRVNSGVSGPAVTDSGVYATNPDITSMSADQGTFTFTINGRSLKGELFEIVKIQSFAKSKAGTAGADGGNGADGLRGSLTGYGTQYGLYYSTSWADNSTGTSTQRANRVIDNMLNGTSLTTGLATTSHLRVGDTVTLTDAASATNAITKYWSGTGWVTPGTVISGNLLVGGTISGGLNLNITGFGKFEGSNGYTVSDPIAGGTASKTAAVAANTSLAANIGIYAQSSSLNQGAIYGHHTGSGSGVLGYGPAANGTGVSGYGAYGASGKTTGGSGNVGVAGFAGNASDGSIGVRAVAIQAGNYALKIEGRTTTDGQIISTLATGTAPFIVASTTEVANLNVAQLKGKTWAAPDPIGATTPNTGRFSTLRVDATPTASGANVATFSGLLPTGSAASTNSWAPINLNGTQYWIPVWVD